MVFVVLRCCSATLKYITKNSRIYHEENHSRGNPAVLFCAEKLYCENREILRFAQNDRKCARSDGFYVVNNLFVILNAVKDPDVFARQLHCANREILRFAQNDRGKCNCRGRRPRRPAGFEHDNCTPLKLQGRLSVHSRRFSVKAPNFIL